MPMYGEKWAHAKALPGADRLMQHLHKHEVPFALASNSVRKNVETKVSHHKEAAKLMGVDAAHCIVIEDSLVGIKAAKAAGMKVVAVPSIPNAVNQYSIADFVLNSLLEFQPELCGLPPFEDWIDDGLPIKPFHLNGWYNNGVLCHNGGRKESILPDQVVGIFFGWARFDTRKIFKVVTSIGWEHNCCTSKRKIRMHLLDSSDEAICDQDVQVLLVGYIRGLSKEENEGDGVEILEKDNSIARTSLDLPKFDHHMLLFSEASSNGDSADL